MDKNKEEIEEMERELETLRTIFQKAEELLPSVRQDLLKVEQMKQALIAANYQSEVLQDFLQGLANEMPHSPAILYTEHERIEWTDKFNKFGRQAHELIKEFWGKKDNDSTQ